MRAYLIRRLLLVIPTVLILTILVFLSVRFIPGDVVDVIQGRMELYGAGVIDREAVERRLGLDVPVYMQYGRWVGGIFLHGTLGESLLGGALTVEEKIIDRLPVTIELGVLAIVFGPLDRPAGRHLLGDSQGYGRRLPGAQHRRHRPGHTELLAGCNGDDLPDYLVGLDTPAGMGPFHRGPAGESLGALLPQPDSGDGLLGCHHADDAYYDAGGLKAGLYPHCLVQGAQGACRDYPAHP